MSSNIFRKVVMFIAGYVCYIAIEVTFRGYSDILMGLCGGVLLILIDMINEVMPWHTDILLQSCIGSLMITTCELIVGTTIKICGAPQLWDYSDMMFNYNGVICLEFSLLWIGLSFIAVLLADAINYYAFGKLPKPEYFLSSRKRHNLVSK